ncbi:MAG: esterase [Burkholderiales bacterium]|nr:esterase [Burkholderiales bacterium]
MLIYLHGFNSSPGSHKAQLLKRYMQERGLEDQYRCPALPTSGRRAVAVVEAEIMRHPQESITLVGSSLGGFYSSYLAERHELRAVLINPAVYPHEDLRAYLGVQRNLHTQRQYELTEDHLRQWQQLYLSTVRAQRYLLLVETGDEVLDYRLAVKKYAGARQLVIEGGDHSLKSFPEHIALILDFAGLAPA